MPEPLSSSVTDFDYENVRRYHRSREGRYSFPNDKIEQERENLKHMVIKLLCGKLYYGPMGDSPQLILDVGTGTRIWAIESRSAPTYFAASGRNKDDGCAS